MKNFLLALILLSGIALAEPTKVEITGIALEKGQVVTFVVDAGETHIQMFRADSDFAETDKIVIWLEDIEEGTYSAMLRIYTHRAGAARNNNFAVGKQILEQEVKIEVK
jgi:hypothetical protein